MKKRREPNYTLHKESTMSLDVFSEILEHIKNYPSMFSILKIPRNKALKKMLIVHSELSFMHILEGAKVIPDLSFDLDNKNSENLIQESLKWAVRLINNFCKEESVKKVIEPTRKEIIDFLIFCYKLDLFYNMLFSAGRGEYLLKLTDKGIFFISAKESKDFLAYNAWRQAFREREQINNIKIISMEAIQEVHLSDFSMPEMWNLGGYTLAQFKEVSVHLDGLNSKWFMNHLKKNKVVIVGKYKAEELVRVNHKQWWIEQLVQLTDFETNIVKNIIDDLTYEDFNNNDPSYQFFIPMKNKELALPVAFVASFVRPERNLMALLPKKNQKLFSELTNDCENQQIEYIREKIKDTGIIIIEKKTKAQASRKGMDLMVLDPVTFELLVIELKWRVPPSSTREMYDTDEVVQKGLKQITEAKGWVTENFDTILSDYLGQSYLGLKPTRVEYCVVVNENIGTGTHCDSLVPVVTVDHLVEMLKFGVRSTIDVLASGKHRVPAEYINVKPISFNLCGYKVEFPATELLGTWLDKTLTKKRHSSII
ncbi:hypothetical protein ABEW60_25190 [Paenibacillus jamilae]|uniref:hypothetical protein n=1 Tax=Paenibacillus jamilae TaxID=114136 RepID=UPI003D2E3845